MDIARDIQGATTKGNFGLCFLIEVLNNHNLKAVFFVDSLSANVVGLDPLKQVIQFIQDHDQEVQMHLHSEWLTWMKKSPINGRTGQNLKDFSEIDQGTLITEGLRNLKDAGSRNVCAFRAGNNKEATMTDLEGNRRPGGHAFDSGAYEYRTPSSISKSP
jgi:hypothetical protein